MPDSAETTAEELEAVDILQIMEMLPHRYPMLLVDRVKDIVSGESAVGVKCVTMNEGFFQGHFPAEPVMPGVLILEAMAQAAGVLAIHSNGESTAGGAVYFMGIDGAKFRKPVRPGDVLELHVSKEHARRTVWRFRGEGRVNGVLVAEATLTAMLSTQ